MQPEEPPYEREPVSTDQLTAALARVAEGRPAGQPRDAGTSRDRADGGTSPDRADVDPLAAAAARMRAAADVLPPPALVELAARLGLSRVRARRAADVRRAELDPSIGGLFARRTAASTMPLPDLRARAGRAARPGVGRALAAGGAAATGG